MTARAVSVNLCGAHYFQRTRRLSRAAGGMTHGAPGLTAPTTDAVPWAMSSGNEAEEADR